MFTKPCEELRFTRNDISFAKWPRHNIEDHVLYEYVTGNLDFSTTGKHNWIVIYQKKHPTPNFSAPDRPRKTRTKTNPCFMSPSPEQHLAKPDQHQPCETVTITISNQKQFLSPFNGWGKPLGMGYER